jgi:hypothetical protein
MCALSACAQSGALLADETAAVRAAAREYLSAVERGDAAKLRALWTADGDYVDAAGKSYNVEQLIEHIGPLETASADAVQASPPQSTWRLPAPGVAIEDGSTASEDIDRGNGHGGRYTAIWVKQNGKWLLSALREAAARPLSGHPKLQPLEWLVGEWTGVADDSVTLVSWHWNDGGNFLVGEFVIYRDGQPLAGGSQRVGWDPVAGQIKSWIFDSQGTAGEGSWRADGDRWRVDSTQVTADGKRATSTAIYTPAGEHAFTLEITGDWQSGDAEAGAAKLPMRRIEFRRALADE